MNVKLSGNAKFTWQFFVISNSLYRAGHGEAGDSRAKLYRAGHGEAGDSLANAIFIYSKSASGVKSKNNVSRLTI